LTHFSFFSSKSARKGLADRSASCFSNCSNAWRRPAVYCFRHLALEEKLALGDFRGAPGLQFGQLRLLLGGQLDGRRGLLSRSIGKFIGGLILA